MTNYYDVLGLNKNSNEDEIKHAYRNLAKTHHPDKGGSKEKFQEIQEAYDTLSNPEKKSAYDNPHFSPFDNMFGGMGGHSNMSGFPFNIFQPQQQTNKRMDHHYTCTIKLNEVFTGLKKTFNLKRNFKCKNCQINCNSCNGSGNRPQRIQIGPIIQILNQPCNQCNCTGKIRDEKNCDMCINKGIIEEEKTIEIVIPKGVDNNYKFTYEEWGEQAEKDNEKSGNLIITIEVQKHEHFERKGLDLHYKEKLTFRESVIGKKLNIPYFSSTIYLETKEYGIINPFRDYIIFQRGLENSKGQKGSLYIKFEIEYSNKILNDIEIEELNNLFTKLNLE